jgi:hypothetical protein
MGEMAGPPWAAGAATGVGSLPGTDAGEALRLVLGELPDLPHLPELPARGPGGDMLGRGIALLTDLHADLQPAGWRLTGRPGVDGRRAADLLARDLDVLADLAGEYAGPFKVQAVGVWTLAASVELPRGDKVLADPGAVRDLGQSLAEGMGSYVADVRRRLPQATVLLQLDEPALPAVLLGRVPTASGFGRLPVVESPDARAGLAALLQAAAAAGAFPLVHCCAPAPPLGLLRDAGARAVSVDVTLLTPDDDEAVGEAVEAGLGLFAGVVPAKDAELSDPSRTVAVVRRLWGRLGFAPERLAETVVVTPSCGLAGASPGYARAALAHCRAAGRVLLEEPEVGE